MSTINYYKSVVEATEVYLGPAAQRFINRQIDFHLNKQPEQINRGDVIKLKESLRVALGLLVNDKKVVEEAVHKFDEIASK